MCNTETGILSKADEVIFNAKKDTKRTDFNDLVSYPGYHFAIILKMVSRTASSAKVEAKKTGVTMNSGLCWFINPITLPCLRRDRQVRLPEQR